MGAGLPLSLEERRMLERLKSIYDDLAAGLESNGGGKISDAAETLITGSLLAACGVGISSMRDVAVRICETKTPDLPEKNAGMLFAERIGRMTLGIAPEDHDR